MTARHVPFDEWLSLSLFVFGELGSTLAAMWFYWPIKVHFT